MDNFIKRARVIIVLLCIMFLGIFVFSQRDFKLFKSLPAIKHSDDKRSPEETQKDFDEFINSVFIEEVSDDSITLNYSVKNKQQYGLAGIPPTLGETSLKSMKDSLFISENRLASMESFNYDNLTAKQQLIYDILYNMLKQNLESSGILEYSECLGPVSGIQAQLPVLFAEFNFYVKDDIDTYIELLRLVPAYFDSIIEFEKEKSSNGLFMGDTTVQAIISQCNEFIETSDENYLITVFNSKIKNFQGLTEEEITSYINSNSKAVTECVIPAYKNLVNALVKLKGTGKNDNGLCGFKKGKEYYEYLVKAKTGSYRSITEIDRMLSNALSDSQQQMAKIMTKTPDVYYKAQELEYPYKEPEKAIEYLKKAINKDFPALGDDITCEIKYVDKSLEEHLSPAFYLTPAIDSYKENVVYLNKNQKYDLSEAFSTIAHESYPGHLYQNCYFQSLNPEPIRSVINCGGYSEGWATYAELYSYSIAGIDKDVAGLMVQNTIATLCVYGKADVGVNYMGWDFKKLQGFLSDYGFSKSQSRMVFDSVVAEPADYLQYTLGYLEIEELKKEAQNKLGSQFSLKDFHKFFLSTGTAPFSVIEDYLGKWIEEMQNDTI
ncbi:MAG: DUF885 domain-containing protein [Lachnospiraceae bacterium]|nr:DUF885 domain-containing protein [Lachnospiraceae bacterium]